MAMANEFARDVYILRLKNDPLERESLFSRITTAMHTHLLRADLLEHTGAVGVTRPRLLLRLEGLQLAHQLAHALVQLVTLQAHAPTRGGRA